jgi:hypothetical protein
MYTSRLCCASQPHPVSPQAGLGSLSLLTGMAKNVSTTVPCYTSTAMVHRRSRYQSSCRWLSIVSVSLPHRSGLALSLAAAPVVQLTPCEWRKPQAPQAYAFPPRLVGHAIEQSRWHPTLVSSSLSSSLPTPQLSPTYAFALSTGVPRQDTHRPVCRSE